MFKTLPNIKITAAQMGYLKMLKEVTGSAYAVTVRSLIQKALDKEIADNTIANQLDSEANN